MRGVIARIRCEKVSMFRTNAGGTVEAYFALRALKKRAGRYFNEKGEKRNERKD